MAEGRRLGKHAFEQRGLPVKLKIFCTRVGRQGQKNRPFPLKSRERFHGITPHVGGHRHGIGPQSFVHRPRILGGRVADVPPLGIRNAENVFGHPLDDPRQGRPPLGTVLLEESQVGLERHRIRSRGFDDGVTKRLHPLHPMTEGVRNFGWIGIQANAQKRAFGLNGLKQALGRGQRRVGLSRRVGHAAKVRHEAPKTRPFRQRFFNRSARSATCKDSMMVSKSP